MKLLWVSLTLAFTLAAPAVMGQAPPNDLQASGLARVGRVRDQARRSGFQPSLLAELATAATELETSYRRFRAAANESAAAASLVGLGDSERLAYIFLINYQQTQNVSQQADALARNARGHYEEAAALSRKTKNATSLVKALNGLVLIDESQHDYGAANAHINEAMRAAPLCPTADCMLDALLSKVDVETYRGELFSAASHVNGLIALLKHNPDPYRQYSAYFDRSSIYRAMTEGCTYNQQKSVDVCLRLFELARADMVTAGAIVSKAGFTNNAQMAAEEITQLDLLRSLTQQYNGSARAVIDKLGFAPTTPEDVLVTDIVPLGQLSRNEVEAMKTLRQTVGHGTPGALEVWIQAQMDDIQGRSDAALTGYLRAIRMVEEDRRKLGEASARSSFLDDKISVYERPILLLVNSKRYREAFSLLESSRARATADLLSTKSAGLSRPADRRLFATLARKKAEITSIQKRFFNETLSAQSDTTDDPQALIKAQAHLAELEEEYEQMLLRAGREAPGAQDASVSQSVSLDSVQAALRQDRMDLLYYFVIDNAVILMHVGPDSIHVRNIFLPHLALMTKVAELRASMGKRDAEFREDIAQQLFLYLIQPALAWLSTDRLVIIPQAELQSLPFQAFRSPSDGSYLGERFQITYAPSASILLKLNRQPNLSGGPILAAADPSLRGAADEVNALGRLYPKQPRLVTDSLMRKTDLEQSVASYRIVHLAVHGEFDSQEPLLSNVQLAGAGGQDGTLTAAEMFGLALEKTQIVTLSACETGRVRTTRSNEIQGIQQALLFAGAQSLLVSSWKVDSDATSLWMQTFYREAQTKTPAEAAREAIRRLRRDSKYSHPFYWAPFLLIAR